MISWVFYLFVISVFSGPQRRGKCQMEMESFARVIGYWGSASHGSLSGQFRVEITTDHYYQYVDEGRGS